MNELLQEYKKGTYKFKQIYREKKYAIYEQIDTRDGQLMYYEVFKIPVRPECTLRGEFYPEHEGYPSSEEWGQIAYSVKTLQDAKEKIKLMKQASQIYKESRKKQP